MIAQDGGGPVLELEAFLNRMVGLHPELRQLFALLLGEPPRLYLVQLTGGPGGVEKDQSLGRGLHVPLGGRPEPTLPPYCAVEVQHGTPAQLLRHQGQQRLGGGVGGQGEETFVMVGAGEELDTGRQFLGPVRSLGVAGSYAFDEFLLPLAVRLVGKPPGTVEIEIVEGFLESLDRIHVPW